VRSPPSMAMKIDDAVDAVAGFAVGEEERVL
jgi:hypothetical protein